MSKNEKKEKEPRGLSEKFWTRRLITLNKTSRKRLVKNAEGTGGMSSPSVRGLILPSQVKTDEGGG